MQNLIQKSTNLKKSLEEQIQITETAKKKQFEYEVLCEDLKKEIDEMGGNQQGMESQFG